MEDLKLMIFVSLTGVIEGSLKELTYFCGTF